MKQKGFYSATLFIVFLILTSCVKEDLSDCKHDINIRFEYTLNTQSEDLFKDKVNTLDLLVYNSKHILVDRYSELQANLTAGNTLALSNLPTDSCYTFLVWANLSKEHYNIGQISVLEDMRVAYNTSNFGEYNADPLMDSFFYGSNKVSLADLKGSQALTISLTNNTHRVYVHIEETDTSRPIDLTEYKVELSGTNGTYNSANNSVGPDLLQYKPTYNFPQQHEIRIDFTSLRVLATGDLRLKVYGHNSKLLYDEALVDLLYQSAEFTSQEDLDSVQEYNLRFKVKRDDTQIEIDLIGINDWESIDQNGSL